MSQDFINLNSTIDQGISMLEEYIEEIKHVFPCKKT